MSISSGKGAAVGHAGISRGVGRYALGPLIASGGMAEVHLGHLGGLGGFSRVVAIKHLHPHLARDAEFRTMFLDEARLAARIRHINVVSVLDVLEVDGDVFLVMDYVHGESLSRLVRACNERSERLEVDVAVTIVAGVLHGLHAAHEVVDEHGRALGIVHRDVSPQNVLVGVDGVARIVDFGVAKAGNRLQSTRDGQVKGKLAYMAPEQILEQPVDRRTDVYAAAVLLWEALTNRRLFQTADVGATVAAILAGGPPPPSWHRPGMPPALDEVVLRGLATAADDRFATAHEMAVALERALPLASSTAVSAWVESLAADELRTRSTRLAALERASLADREATASGRVAVAETGQTQLAAERAPEVADGGDRRRAIRATFGAGLVLIPVAIALAVLQAKPPGTDSSTQPGLPAGSSVAVSVAPPSSPASTSSASAAAPSATATAAPSTTPAAAPCAAGPCRPVTLASGVRGVSALALADGRVFFATSNGVKSIPATGGEPATVTAVAQGAYATATWRDRIYFSGSKDLFQVASAGGPAALVGSTSGTALGVAAGPAGVYWTADDRVWRLAPDASQPAVIAAGQRGALAIAVRNGFVYWTCYTHDGAIVRAPETGGAAATLLAGQHNPAGLAVDDTHAYFAVQDDGLVAAVPVAGGERRVLASGQKLPTGVAAFRGWVYFTDQATGTVLAVRAQGGPVLTLASGQSYPTAIAADERGVFWVTSGGTGAVMGIPTESK